MNQNDGKGFKPLTKANVQSGCLMAQPGPYIKQSKLGTVLQASGQGAINTSWRARSSHCSSMGRGSSSSDSTAWRT